MKKWISFIEQKYKYILFALIAIQAILLFLIFLFNGVSYEGDTSSYTGPAESFLRTGVFINDGMFNDSNSPILFRTPGYPFLIAIMWLVSGHSDIAIILLQIIMSILCTYMIWNIGYTVTQSRSVGLVGVLFYVFDMTNYHHAISILTDIPSAFFICLAIFLAMQAEKKKSAKYVLGAIISLFTSLIIRPGIVYFCYLFVFILIIGIIKKKISLATLGIYVGILFIVVGGWSFRNYVSHGRFMFTSVRQESYLEWYAPYVYELVDEGSFDDAKNVFEKELYQTYPQYDTMTPLERMDARSTIGKNYIDNHIVGYLLLNLKGLVSEMIQPERRTLRMMGLPEWAVTIVSCVCTGLLVLCYLFYALGFIKNIRKNTLVDWTIFLLTAYLMASTAVLGYYRFRIQFYIPCIIGAMISWRKRDAGSNI